MNVLLFYITIPFGILAGLSYLPWMWCLLLMWGWFVINPSRWNSTLEKLTIILYFLYTALCLWSGFQYIIEQLTVSNPFVSNIFTCIFILSIGYYSYKKFKSMQLYLYWTILVCCLLGIGHLYISWWAGLEYSLAKCLYSAFALQLLLIFFPAKNLTSPTQPIPYHIKPVFIIAFVIVAGGQWVQFSHLSNLSQIENQYNTVAKNAIKAGYTQTAIGAVLNESARLSSKSEIHKAIQYLRSQWEHLPKEQLAKQYREHHQLQENPFLFLCTFGGRLGRLREEIIDGVLIHEPLQLIIATTGNRLWKITPYGIEPFKLIHEDLQRLHHEPITNTLYGMTLQHTVFIKQKDTVNYLHLPKENKWVDVVFSSSGSKLWALHSRGGITAYENQNGKWEHRSELYPALWQNDELAIRLLHEEIEDGIVFYVLDSHKGITARAPEALQDHVLTKNDLYRFFHPERNFGIDAQFYDDQIVIADQFGQMDFVQDGVGSNFTEWKFSIRANSRFERQSGMWLRDGDTVGLIPYPEANTILLLKHNGIIEALAMPQGFRIPQLKRNGWWRVRPELRGVLG